MIFIMLTLLMVQLQGLPHVGHRRVSCCRSGMIGVVGALLLFGRPLGFVAILGILALIGMIAKNAVILITQINDERADGAWRPRRGGRRRRRTGCGRCC